MNRAQTIITGFDPDGPFAGLILPRCFREAQKKTRFKQEWKVSWSQFMAMMNEFRGPKYQRGIICATAIYGGVAGQVVLTNNTATSERFTAGTATAQWDFNTNGDLVGATSHGPNTDPSGEWWNNEPETSIGSSYAVRALSSGKVGTWSTSAAADNTWTTMTAQRTWSVSRSINGSKSASATFEVGPAASGPADDSATLTATAIVDTL